MQRVAFIFAALAAIAAAPASAQDLDDYNMRRADLVTLSSIFGELHHIRRNCEPHREANVWRERMKRLIALEAPQPETHERMVAGFNEGYRWAKRRFAECSRRARDHAAARAREGSVIVARLTTPLRDATEKDAASPFLWSRDVTDPSTD